MPQKKCVTIYGYSDEFYTEAEIVRHEIASARN